MSQSKFERLMEERFEGYENKLERQIGGVRNNYFNRARLELFSIVTESVGEEGTFEGTVQRQKLDRVERLIYQGLNEEIEQSVRQSAQEASENLNVALLEVVGIPTLIQAHGLTAAVASGGLAEEVLTANAEFLLGIATFLPSFVDAITRSTYSRKGTDDKSLRDRIRAFAKDLRRKIARELQKQKGQPVDTVNKTLDRVFRENGWKVDRLTETESMFAYRQAIAKAAEENPDIITGVRIKDFTHGDPAVHRTHMCYIYANRDEHGMGRGVYPVGTRKIRNPHPQCRSILIPQLAEPLL